MIVRHNNMPCDMENSLLLKRGYMCIGKRLRQVSDESEVKKDHILTSPTDHM